MTYALAHIPADNYAQVSTLLVARFELRAARKLANEWDVLFRDYDSSCGVISLEWDNWTEFTVVAKQASAEPLVREIALFLEQCSDLQALLAR